MCQDCEAFRKVITLRMGSKSIVRRKGIEPHEARTRAKAVHKGEISLLTHKYGNMGE